MESPRNRALARPAVATTGLGNVPDAIHFMDALPKGRSGKIQRLTLAEHPGVAWRLCQPRFRL